MGWMRAVGVVSTLWLASGCDTGCDQDTIDGAVSFMKAHQSCNSDDDCTTVSDFCEELPGGFCGQLVMSREGAESERWKAIGKELEDCGPSTCTTCDAARLPRCQNGSCGGP